MNREIITRELERVKKEIDNINRKNSLIFILYSDLHSHGVEEDRTAYFIDRLEDICNVVKPDAVIDMGDNFAMLGREQQISNLSLVDKYSELLGTIKQKINSPLFFMNGNHDSIGTDFYKPKFWYDIVNNGYDDGLAKRCKGRGYFYVDYDSMNTRMVFLSIPHNSNIDAEYPTPIWAFGKEQLKWFDEVALDTKHNVLMFCHVPLFFKYGGDMNATLKVWNGEKSAFSYIKDLSGRVDDAENAAYIVEKHKNVIACFSGHVHRDILLQPYEMFGELKNYLPCPQVTTQKPVPYTWDNDEGEFGFSIDVMVFEPDKHKVDIIRFGDGEDRKVL